MTSEYLSDKATGPILVSISCITYNHAPYIRQCLDGFMMQQTNFAFEVLIHDDASTDGTTDIIKEYEAQYPDIIKPIYEEENQWVKGRRGSAVFNFPRANGKYIALCEGDDYWTDPLKLQKQIDFLENNSEYIMCSHFRKLHNQNTNEIYFNEKLRPVDYDLNSLITGEWFFQPVTVVFRNIVDYQIFAAHEKMTDVVLFYHLLKRGKGMCLPELMAVYRLHNAGVWSLATQSDKWLQEFKVRLDIVNVERSYDSARFLYNQLAKQVSRKWLLKNYMITLNVLGSLSEHLTYKQMLKIIVGRFLLNRPLKII